MIPQINTPSITIAGRVFTDLDNLIILGGSTGSSGDDTCTFREPNGTAGYQVPVGKKLVVKAMKCSVLSVTAAVQFSGALVYADADVGLNSTTSLTNPVYNFNGAFAAGVQSQNTTAQLGNFEEIIEFTVIAQKYLCINRIAGVAATKFLAFCYLEDV